MTSCSACNGTGIVRGEGVTSIGGLRTFVHDCPTCDGGRKPEAVRVLETYVRKLERERDAALAKLRAVEDRSS